MVTKIVRLALAIVFVVAVNGMPSRSRSSGSRDLNNNNNNGVLIWILAEEDLHPNSQLLVERKFHHFGTKATFAFTTEHPIDRLELLKFAPHDLPEWSTPPHIDLLVGGVGGKSVVLQYRVDEPQMIELVIRAYGRIQPDNELAVRSNRENYVLWSTWFANEPESDSKHLVAERHFNQFGTQATIALTSADPIGHIELVSFAQQELPEWSTPPHIELLVGEVGGHEVVVLVRVDEPQQLELAVRVYGRIE